MNISFDLFKHITQSKSWLFSIFIATLCTSYGLSHIDNKTEQLTNLLTIFITICCISFLLLIFRILSWVWESLPIPIKHPSSILPLSKEEKDILKIFIKIDQPFLQITNPTIESMATINDLRNKGYLKESFDPDFISLTEKGKKYCIKTSKDTFNS